MTRKYERKTPIGLQRRKRRATETLVRHIKTNPDNKTQAELAQETGFTQSTISKIQRGEIYGWVS